MSGLVVVLVILGILFLFAIIGIVVMVSSTSGKTSPPYTPPYTPAPPPYVPMPTPYVPPPPPPPYVPAPPPYVPPPVQKQTGVWKCVTASPTAHVATRINPSTGRVECMSFNGVDCKWASSLAFCQSSDAPNANNPDIRPAACTPDQEANTAGWCGKALQLF